jgi:hypothetical protein
VVRDDSTPAPSPPNRAGARTLVGLYLLLLGVYLLTTPGDFRSIDEVHVYLTTQSIVENHTLAIAQVYGTVRTPSGLDYSRAEPAQAVLSVPLYLLGRFADEVGTPAMRYLWAGPNLGLWGGSVPLYFVSLFNQLVTPLLAVFVFLFCIELGARRSAALHTALAFALGTAAWEQSRNYFQHPLETLLLLAAIYVLYHSRHRESMRPALLAGALMGAGLLTRVNLAITLPLLAAYVVIAGDQPAVTTSAGRLPSPNPRPFFAAAPVRQRYARDLVARLRRRWRPLLAFALPVLVAGAAIALINDLRFGSALALHGVPDHRVAPNVLSGRWEGLFGNLFSPGRSLFLYSPPVLVGLFAFTHFYRQHRREAMLFASVAVVSLLFCSLLRWWVGGWAWGPRFLFAITPLLMIPCAPWLQTRARVAALVLALVVGIGVQIAGVAIHWGYVYLEWGKLQLIPDDAYLFYPQISAIPTHLHFLMQGRFLDPWLIWVYREVGISPALFALAAPPCALVILGLYVLGQPRTSSARVEADPREELTATDSRLLS